jgi:hypothetical protein
MLIQPPGNTANVLGAAMALMTDQELQPFTIYRFVDLFCRRLKHHWHAKSNNLSQ